MPTRKKWINLFERIIYALWRWFRRWWWRWWYKISTMTNQISLVLSNENVSPALCSVKKKYCSSIVKISGHKLLLTRNEWIEFICLLLFFALFISFLVRRKSPPNQNQLNIKTTKDFYSTKISFVRFISVLEK